MLIGSDDVWNFRQPLVDGQPSASLREVPSYVAEQRLLTVPDVKHPRAVSLNHDLNVAQR